MVYLARKKPVLGICVGRDEQSLRKEFQRIAKRRIASLPKNPFRKTILFTFDHVNFEAKTVEGFEFNLEKHGVKLAAGRFPLPHVFYLQCTLSNEEVAMLENSVKGKVFNNFFYSKWECWNLLNQSNELEEYLPRTQLLIDEDGLELFLSNYKHCYMKPIEGHSGKGIWKLNYCSGSKIIVSQVKRRKTFTNISDLWVWVRDKMEDGPYMIQQGIDTVSFMEEATDIRLNMNKNKKSQWEVSFLVGRMALNQPFITAGSNHNALIQIDALLKKVVPTIALDSKKDEIILLGKKICESFDELGYHMADLGIDLGIDNKGKLWIFEVNNLPLPINSNDDHSLTKPLEYAYYLTKKRS